MCTASSRRVYYVDVVGLEFCRGLIQLTVHVYIDIHHQSVFLADIHSNTLTRFHFARMTGVVKLHVGSLC